MTWRIAAFLAMTSVSMFGFAAFTEAGTAHARELIPKQRSIVAISALAAMTGTAGQLRFHFGAEMNTGLTESQMKEFISVLEAMVGKKEAESANQVLTAVLQSRR